MKLIGQLSKKTTKRFSLNIDNNGTVAILSDNAKDKKIGDIVNKKEISIIMEKLPVIEMDFRIEALETSYSGTGYLSVNGFQLYNREATELLNEIQKNIFEKEDKVKIENGYFKAKFVLLFSNRSRNIRLLNENDIIEQV